MADKVEKRILTLYSDVQATSVHWLWYPCDADRKRESTD